MIENFTSGGGGSGSTDYDNDKYDNEPEGGGDDSGGGSIDWGQKLMGSSGGGRGPRFDNTGGEEVAIEKEDSVEVHKAELGTSDDITTTATSEGNTSTETEDDDSGENASGTDTSGGGSSGGGSSGGGMSPSEMMAFMVPFMQNNQRGQPSDPTFSGPPTESPGGGSSGGSSDGSGMGTFGIVALAGGALAAVWALFGGGS